MQQGRSLPPEAPQQPIVSLADFARAVAARGGQPHALVYPDRYAFWLDETERMSLAFQEFHHQLSEFWRTLAITAIGIEIEEASAMGAGLPPPWGGRIAAASRPVVWPGEFFADETTAHEPEPRPKTYARANITKNKRRGKPKARRRPGAQSRRRNRRNRV